MSLPAIALAAWSAALPWHRLPGVPRGGAGEVLFPLAVLAAAPAFARRDARRGLVPALVVVLGFLPSALAAANPSVALRQLLVFGYVGTIFALARAAALLGHGRTVLLGYVGSAVLAGAFGLAHGQVAPWLTMSLARPVGATESPNMLALVCAVALVARARLASDVADRRHQAALRAVGAFLVVVVGLTLGHVAIAGAAAAFVVGARRVGPRATLAAGAAAATSVAGSVLFRLLPLASSPPFVDLRPSPYRKCAELALTMLRAHPWLGVGIEGFARAWPDFDGPRFAAYYPAGQEHLASVPLDPHSTWLGYLAEAGLSGAIVLGALVALALRARARAPSRALDALLVFLALAAAVVDVLTSRETALVLGVLVVPMEDAPREGAPPNTP